MNRTIDDLIAALGNLCSQAITEGDYDPENDIIRDPFCRNVNEVAGLAISDLETLREVIEQAAISMDRCGLLTHADSIRALLWRQE